MPQMLRRLLDKVLSKGEMSVKCLEEAQPQAQNTQADCYAAENPCSSSTVLPHQQTLKHNIIHHIDTAMNTSANAGTPRLPNQTLSEALSSCPAVAVSSNSGQRHLNEDRFALKANLVVLPKLLDAVDLPDVMPVVAVVNRVTANPGPTNHASHRKSSDNFSAHAAVAANTAQTHECQHDSEQASDRHHLALHFYAVYDGHGGAGVAQHCSQALHNNLLDAMATCAHGGGVRASDTGSIRQTLLQPSQLSDPVDKARDDEGPGARAHPQSCLKKFFDTSIVQAQPQISPSVTPATCACVANHSPPVVVTEAWTTPKTYIPQTSSLQRNRPAALPALSTAPSKTQSPVVRAGSSLAAGLPPPQAVCSISASGRINGQQSDSADVCPSREVVCPSYVLVPDAVVPESRAEEGTTDTHVHTTAHLQTKPSTESHHEDIYEPLPRFDQPPPALPRPRTQSVLDADLALAEDDSGDGINTARNHAGTGTSSFSAPQSTRQLFSCCLDQQNGSTCSLHAEGAPPARRRPSGTTAFPGGCSVACVEAALCQAFLQTDEELGRLARDQGCTALVALVGPQHVWIANAGDSRAVLCRNGKAVVLSQDHKPSRKDEMLRVQAAGGHVWWNRVMGELAVTRAIGDHLLRPYVIAEPEISRLTRCDGDQLLLLASDGLWDVLSCQEACDVATATLTEQLAHGSSPSKCMRKIANKLTEHALARGSRDNVTALVIDLRPATGAAESSCLMTRRSSSASTDSTVVICGPRTPSAQIPVRVASDAVVLPPHSPKLPPVMFTLALRGMPAQLPRALAVPAGNMTAAGTTTTGGRGCLSEASPRQDRAYVNPVLRAYLSQRMEQARASAGSITDGGQVRVSVFPLAMTSEPTLPTDIMSARFVDSDGVFRGTRGTCSNGLSGPTGPQCQGSSLTRGILRFNDVVEDVSGSHGSSSNHSGGDPGGHGAASRPHTTSCSRSDVKSGLLLTAAAVPKPLSAQHRVSPVNAGRLPHSDVIADRAATAM